MKSVPAELRVAEGANLSEHVYYRDKFGVKFVFNHFDITEESHYQYYVRCVERFRAAINGRDPCLLLCITQEVSVGDFEALCALFTQKDCVSVLCVRATPDCPHVFGMTLSAERGRHKLYDLRMKGDLGPLAFTDPAEFPAVRQLVDLRRERDRAVMLRRGWTNATTLERLRVALRAMQSATLIPPAQPGQASDRRLNARSLAGIAAAGSRAPRAGRPSPRTRFRRPGCVRSTMWEVQFRRTLTLLEQ